MSWGTAFLVAIGIVVVGFIIALIYDWSCNRNKNSKQGSKQKQSEKLFEFEKDWNTLQSTLIVNRRDPLFERWLDVEANKEVFFEDVPDKYIYTGASVGGITTGGVHVQKGGLKANFGSKTGEYYLMFHVGRNYADYGGLHRIKLSGADLSDARKNERLLKLLDVYGYLKADGLSKDDAKIHCIMACR